jgi:hypothetical protein
MPPKKPSSKVADDYTKKCHYTMKVYSCTHKKWELDPRISHKGHCTQTASNRNTCRNMAGSPLERKMGRICNECRVKEGAATGSHWGDDLLLFPNDRASKLDPSGVKKPGSVTQTGKKITLAGMAAKLDPPEAKKSGSVTQTGKKSTVAGPFKPATGPVVTVSNPATQKLTPQVPAVKQVPVTAPVKPKLKAENALSSADVEMIKALEELSLFVQPAGSATKKSNEQPPASTISKNSAASEPTSTKKPEMAAKESKLTLSELGWVKIQEDPDWEVIPLPTDKDLRSHMKSADAYDEGSKDLGRNDTWVRVEKPEAVEPVQDDDWEVVGKEEGEYQQGVDGWEMTKGGKNSCRTQ